VDEYTQCENFIPIDFLNALQAAKRNLTYPQYAWITYGWYPDNWWTKAVSKNNVSCSDEQLEKFVEKARMLLIRQYPTPDDVDAATIAGIVSSEALRASYQTILISVRMELFVLAAGLSCYLHECNN